MVRKELTFIGKNITFYSAIDEEFFYKWIKQIKVIDKLEHTDDEWVFYMKGHEISKQDLDKLVGFFARYKLDTKQLKVYLNEQNKVWLKYWV